MTQFKSGDRVRINEGELEGLEGTAVAVESNRVSVKLDMLYGEGILALYTETLVSADEPHAALAHLKNLYPDFLKSDSYRYRLTTFVDGIIYVSSVPLDAETLKDALRKPPAGLERVEFMLKQDDPNRGLAWKMLWSS